MHAIEFPEVNVRIAEDQPEYLTLPAFWNGMEGTMTFCFKLNDDELNRMYATGELWFKVFTGGEPFHPIVMSTNKEDLIPPIPELVVVYGEPGSGKSDVLDQIAKRAKSLRVTEKDLHGLTLVKGAYSHVLIDECVGSVTLHSFIHKYKDHFRIIISTQNKECALSFGHFRVQLVPLSPL